MQIHQRIGAYDLDFNLVRPVEERGIGELNNCLRRGDDGQVLSSWIFRNSTFRRIALGAQIVANRSQKNQQESQCYCYIGTF